jgi:hypothetical protein
VDDKLKMLDCYISSTISPETLLFAWLLMSVYPNEDRGPLAYKVVLNFSCKILEYYNYTIKDINTPEIKKIETQLIDKIHNKEIIFTPVFFFLYYYLYKLAKLCPRDYNLIGTAMESIGISFIFLFLLDPVIYRDELTYHEMVKDVIKLTIDFLKNQNKLDEKNSLYQICLKNSDRVPDKLLRMIVPEINLYYHLLNQPIQNIEPRSQPD